MKYIAIIFIQLLALGLQAQSLGEDASLNYFWKNQLGIARLYNDNGLGKEILLRNLPVDWFNAKSYDLFSSLHDAGFGHLLLAPSYTGKLGLNANVNHVGEAGASLRTRLNMKKISTNLLVNGSYFNRLIDQNEDGFTDQATKQRFLFSNTWEANVPNYSSSNRIQFMGLRERGGQLGSFSDTMSYGIGLNFSHLSIQSQHLIALRAKDFLLFDIKVKDHQQKRYWGNRDYKGEEWLAEASARYEYHLDKDLDIFRIGFQYKQQRFDEQLDSVSMKRHEQMLGGVIGYDSYWGKHLLVITQANMLYHNLAGLRISPVVKVNYSPLKNLVINVQAGNAWRYANPLTENAAYLFSGRKASLPSNPLLPENAWYYNIAAASNTWVRWGYYRFSNFFLRGTTKFTHQIYTQQVIADVDADAYELRFYNLQKGDKAYRLSWGFDGQISWSRPSLVLNVDYRYDKAKSTIDGVLRDLPFYSRHNWLINLTYACNVRGNGRNFYLFQFQSYLYLQSSQRIPDVTAKSIGYPTSSGAFGRWDIQFMLPVYSWIKSPKKWKNFMINLGVDNLTNTKQPITLLHREHPFGAGFDAGMGWNTWVGTRFYVGLKYSLM